MFFAGGKNQQKKTALNGKPGSQSLGALTVVLEMFQLPLGNEPNSGFEFFRHIDFADCAVYTSIYSDLDIFCEIIYLLRLTLFFFSFSVVFDVYRDSRVSEQ